MIFNLRLIDDTVYLAKHFALDEVAKQSLSEIHSVYLSYLLQVPIDDLDDAIDYYNSGRFGLSSGIVTTDLDSALRAAKELRTGTTNINEVPGFRIESSPFGGIKDSGLGIKEGVIESIKTMSHVKTMSFPW